MKYGEIVALLGLDAAADMEAARLLDGMVKEPDVRRLAFLEGRCAIVFGAGPSLKTDIGDIKDARLHRSCVMVAAGGAVKALLSAGVIPKVHVTDLDGDMEATLEANRRGCVTVVHAHGDNTEALKEYVPRLRNAVGTTQTPAFGKLRNYGGFSDGDRAAYLAEHFGSRIIALAGMDFGEQIGEYSGSRDEEFTRKKLEVGKKLIEELAEKNRGTVVNLTARGEQLAGIPKISAKQLKAAAAHLP